MSFHESDIIVLDGGLLNLNSHRESALGLPEEIDADLDNSDIMKRFSMDMYQKADEMEKDRQRRDTLQKV